MPYQADLGAAQEAADRYALFFDQTVPHVREVRFLGNLSSELATAVTTRQVHERIAITAARAGLDNDEFSIQGWRIQVTPDGLTWMTLFLEAESVAQWVTPTFAAGNFTGNGSMTWTVDAGDVTTLAYLIVGKTMTVAFHIITTDVGGTPSTALQILIPAGKTAAKTMTSTMEYSDAGGARAKGSIQVLAGGTQIQLLKADPTANWTSTTGDNTLVLGQITFELQ
jgi:hypothetical protein